MQLTDKKVFLPRCCVSLCKKNCGILFQFFFFYIIFKVPNFGLTCQYRAQRRIAFSRRSDDGKELNSSLAPYYLNAWDGLCEQKFCCHVIEGGRFDASNISFASSSLGASFFAERPVRNASDTRVASISNTLEQYKVRCLFGKMMHRW